MVATNEGVEMTLEDLQGTGKILLSTIPGEVTLLQATGSDNTLACAALVVDGMCKA